MNPHAVEEIILDAAEAAGHRIRRNHAYTGDGGIDGAIMVDGVWHLVQTKRYRKTISPQHVADFTALCARRGQPGLFVHRSEEHTSELQSLMRISYAVFCLKKKNSNTQFANHQTSTS